MAGFRGQVFERVRVQAGLQPVAEGREGFLTATCYKRSDGSFLL
jgi:hypothetical protein